VLTPIRAKKTADSAKGQKLQLRSNILGLAGSGAGISGDRFCGTRRRTDGRRISSQFRGDWRVLRMGGRGFTFGPGTRLGNRRAEANARSSRWKSSPRPIAICWCTIITVEGRRMSLGR